MSRTTDDWAALLDGTTEGPWESEADYAGGELITDPSRIICSDQKYIGRIHAPDGHLAAAAPEAVAEVVRLRREVSAFRDQMAKSAENYKAMYERDRDLELLLEAECDREIASILTRILKGDNDD